MKGDNFEMIQAAGGLVWRDSARGRELAVVHRPRYGDWTLPKGKVEPGETWQGAALREVREETGCAVRLESLAGCISYSTNGRSKIVVFWNMSAAKCDFRPSPEVDAILWLTVPEALETLDYGAEIDLITRIGQKAWEDRSDGDLR